LPTKKKTKRKTFCISDNAGQQQYEKVVNDPKTNIIKEKEHWEGGDCLIVILYEKTIYESPNRIDGKTNGIPSNVGDAQSRLPKKKSEDEEETSPSQ
jgi:hypothetical protein